MFHSLSSLGGEENAVFQVCCCSGALGPGPEPCSLLPPSDPAPHPAQNPAVTSMICAVSYLPFCSSFVRASRCLAGHNKLIIRVFWLRSPRLDSHVCQACLGVFFTRRHGMCRTSGAASSPEASPDWPSHLRLQEIT